MEDRRVKLSCGLLMQGWQKQFFSGQAKNIVETNGVLAHIACCEIFDFNYIHDYDIVIIGHARVLEQGYWHAIAAKECLSRQN